MAAAFFSLAASSAERALEEVSRISARGRLACTQARHWPSACGWAYSLRICEREQSANRQCCTGKTICATICRSLSTNMSSVCVTTPSVEFSTGTTP